MLGSGPSAVGFSNTLSTNATRRAEAAGSGYLPVGDQNLSQSESSVSRVISAGAIPSDVRSFHSGITTALAKQSAPLSAMRGFDRGSNSMYHSRHGPGAAVSSIGALTRTSNVSSPCLENLSRTSRAGPIAEFSVPTSDSSDESRRRPIATTEEFENMVSDLRRTFIGWLKKTENELKRERENVANARKAMEEERARMLREFKERQEAQNEKFQRERDKLELEISEAMKQIAVEREDGRQRIMEEREKFDNERDLWKHQALMERERFMDQVEAFEEDKRKILDNNIATQTMVELNVGGVVFEASRLTLTQQPGSLLEALLGGRHEVSRDRFGRIFLDRDSEMFRVILQFLRNPATPPFPRDAIESAAILHEANFYGIKLFPFPLVFAIGGHNGSEHLQSVELLDVANQCWRPCQSLDTPRTFFGSACLNGRLHVFGGQNFEYRALCHAENYDVLRDCWFPAPALNLPRRNTCGAALGNRVYAIGGFDGETMLSSVECYDPRLKNWMEVAPLITPRSSATCCTLGDSLYVFGGTSGTRLRCVERFDIRTNHWEDCKCDMIEVHSAASSASLVGHIFVMGGTDNSHRILTSLETLDVHSMKWLYRRSLPCPRMNCAAASISESILLTGGQNHEVLNSTAFYRPEQDEWQEGPVMMSPRYGHGLLVAHV